MSLLVLSDDDVRGLLDMESCITAMEEALAASSGTELRAYRCDRCRRFHLTSRTKGKRVPRPC